MSLRWCSGFLLELTEGAIWPDGSRRGIMSYLVHGERVVDGDASALTALILYGSGSVAVRTLKATEFLYITDVIITSESAGDVILVADSEAAGRYIVTANVAATSSLVVSFSTPYACPRGVVPKFSGAAQGRATCIIQGFIREG